VDRAAPKGSFFSYTVIDLEDLGACYGALAGADAVVHLAAIPRPTYDAPERVFRTNVMTTFNVLEAAATLGIPRVVYASSMAVLGFPFFTTPLAPQYVPIDESHPRLPQDAYALSKTVGEDLADGVVRRAGDRLSVISLRFSWIHTPETFREQLLPFWDNPAGGASNLWSYIDTRDAAGAVRLALEAEVSGHEMFFVSARDSFMNCETASLVRAYYPETEIRPGFEGNQSLFDTRKAARVLGFEASYSWQSYQG
jgi:nucleoside-diphosphate-sugar epimerase